MLAQPRNLAIDIVRDEEQFAALQPAWEGLFERAAEQTPFLRYSWAKRCWDRQRSNKNCRLFVVVVRDADRVVLIAPFVARPRKLILFDLKFLDSLTPHYNDVLIEKSSDAPIYATYLCRFIRRLRRLRKLQIDWQRKESPLLSHFSDNAMTGSDVVLSPYIDLTQSASWEQFYAGLSKNLRADHERKLRQLARIGEVQFHFANSDTLDQDIAWLFAAKREWNERKQVFSAWLSETGTEEFFADVSAEGLASQRTWLTKLSVDGKTIAAYLNFREGSTLYLSKLTYDQDWQRYSVGRALMIMTLEAAFRADIKKYDLMLGNDAWKERFASDAVPTRSVKITMLGRGER